MCRARIDASNGGGSSLFEFESLEPRLCLAAADVPFMAANFSFLDPAFVRQPASLRNVRSAELDVPGEFGPQPVARDYRPNGYGSGTFTWTEPRMMTRSGPGGIIALAGASSIIGLTAELKAVPAPATVASYMGQLYAGYAAAGFTPASPPAEATVPWLITEGGLEGPDVTMRGLAATFTRQSGSSLFDSDESLVQYVFPAGHAPDSRALFFTLALTAQTSVNTTDPGIIPLGEARTEMLGGSTPAAYDQGVLGQVRASLRYEGAVPDTLFLYDFSAENTPRPATLPYRNQFEQPGLPVRFGHAGGNASGPASLAMALEEVGQHVPVAEVYAATMQRGLDVPPETPQKFDWIKARDWAQRQLSDTHGVLFRDDDRWANIDSNLGAQNSVVLRTKLSIGTGTSAGHCILLLGVGDDADVQAGIRELFPSASGDYYVVADPAGHYFADAKTGGFNTGHYGTVEGLRALAKGINYGGWFAIYPKEELQARVDPARTLTINPLLPAADIRVHSPVAVVVTDPQGRKTGVRPEGSVLEEIPNSEYHVAVAEEEEGGGEEVLPDGEKGVVITRPAGGTYEVEIIGTGSGPYTLDVNLMLPGARPSKTTYAGTAAPGVVERYSFTVPAVDAAPTVTAVYLAGSSWAPAFKQHMAAAGAGSAVYGFAVPAAQQLAPRPWANLNQVSITFDQDVRVDAGDLSVRGANVSGYALDPAAFSYDAATRTATWKLAGNSVFANDRLLLDLDGGSPDGVKTAAGLFLDGDWINPVGAAAGGDAFPSGDGTPGGDFAFRVNVLAGDTTGDGTVNALDLADVKRRLNRTPGDGATGGAAYSLFADLDGSARVNALDLAAAKQRLNRRLPLASPSVPN